MGYIELKTEEADGPPPQVALESILDSMGTGRFRYILLVLCGLAFMADAMEVTLMSYISYCAADEWHLSGAQTAALSSCVFLGVMAGNIIFGYISDRKGRRKAYMYGSAMLVVGGFLTAAAPNFPIMVLLRTIVGVGVGSSPIAFDILAEFMPAASRGEFLLAIELFWTVGTMYVAGAAWLMLASHGWRWLVLAATVPVLLALCLSACLLPESPRWLLSQGRTSEAKSVLVDALRLNGRPFAAFHLKPAAVSSDGAASLSRPPKGWTDLLKYGNFKIIFPLYTVWFVLGIGYYAYVLLLSRVFNDDSDIGATEDSQCSFHYRELFISASFEILGVLLGIYLTRLMIGPICLQSVFYGLTALCVFCLGTTAQSHSVVVTTLFASIGRMTVMVATAMTWVATPQLFSTEHRGFGHSTAVAVSRVGAFCAPFLVNGAGLSVPDVSVALSILLCIAAAIVLTLPETTSLINSPT